MNTLAAGAHFDLRSVPLRPIVLTAVLLAATPFPAISQEAEPRVAIHATSLTAPPAVADLLDPFRGDPDSAEVARVLADEVTANGFPVTRSDEILVARLWRRAGETELGLRTLEAMPMAETGSLALLERARLLLETDANREAGTRAYWAACEALDPEALDDVRHDLAAVSTPAERDEWDATGAALDDCAWLREFWSQRAQRMAISPDERLALHYRRLAHARDWYWIPRPRYAQSWADKLGRADGLAIDDRGLMYVRMGPPETDEGFIGLGSEGVDVAFEVADLASVTSSDVLTGLADGELSESRCWPYPRPDGYRIFCFSQLGAGMSTRYGRPDVDLSRADADYKLQESIPGAPGTRFFHRYVMNSNMPRAWLRDQLRARHVDGMGGSDAWEAALSAVESRHYGRVSLVRTRENIEAAVAQIPDVPAIQPTARIRVEALRFLNPAERKWQVWTLAGVRAGDLTPAPAADGTPTLVAGGRFSILSGTDVEIHELAPRHVAEASVADDDGIQFYSVFAADPGPLPLTVVIEDGNRPNTGNYLLDTLNVPAIGGLPMVSDVAIARETGGSWTRDGETFLQITPAHITNGDGTIHAYFEVYQVRPGTNYEVEIRMAPVELTEEILRLDPDDLDFRLAFTARMEGAIGRHHLRLDLGDAPPGEYSLAVRVQDVDTKAYSLPAVTDVFVARDTGGR